MGRKAAQLIPKNFFKKHKIDGNASPQVLLFLYSNDLILSPEANLPEWTISPGEEKLAEDIKKCNDPEQIVKYMRKTMSQPCHSILTRRALALEDQVLPLAENLALRSIQDEFLDSFVELVLYTRKNPCPWIMEHYSGIRSDFLKSQLCVVLGIRGTPKYIGFLLHEVENLQGKDPEDPLEQGPIVALSILKKWPDDDTDWEPRDNASNSFDGFSLEVSDEDAALSPEELQQKMKEDPEFREEVRRQFMQQLLQKKQELEKLRDQGLSVQEIAEQTGIEPEGVETILNSPMNS